RCNRDASPIWTSSRAPSRSRANHICLDRCDRRTYLAYHIRCSECKEDRMTPEVQVLKAHVSINVRNVERSIDFYRRMFGIEPSKVRIGYAKFDVQNPPL